MSTPAGIEANKALVRTYTQTVFNDHHTNRAAEFLARDVKWHGGTLGTMDGADHVAGLVRGIIAALPDLTATGQDIVEEWAGDDYLAVLVNLGVYTPPWLEGR
jgi:hypothetical protein